MSVYTSTNALHYKAGYASSLFSQKRSSIKENAKKIDTLLRSETLEIHNRSGQAIMNSPPSKIAPQTILRSSVVRDYLTTKEKANWFYLLHPGRFFFMWIFLGLLAALS